MTEWIVTVVVLLGVAGSAIKLSMMLGVIKKGNEAEHKALAVSIEEIKSVIGNGSGGLRQEVKDMRINCADEMATVRTELSSYQREIDDVRSELHNR